MKNILIYCICILAFKTDLYTQNVNQDLNAIFFDNAKFKPNIWIEIPSESNYQTYLNIQQNPIIHKSGLPTATFVVGNTLKNYDKHLLSFLSESGYAEIKKLKQITVSSYGEDLKEYYYIFYSDEFKKHITYEKDKAYVNLGYRSIKNITYKNEYEDSPMGMKRTFYAIVFNYSLVNNSNFSKLPIVDKLFEGKAKAFKDPDDGKWKLSGPFDDLGIKFSDKGPSEYTDIFKRSYNAIDLDNILNNTSNNQNFKNLDIIDINFTGFGKNISEKGDYYEGHWLNGKKKGSGKITYKSGITYEGDWNEDKREGYGVIKNANGTLNYEGYFKNNLPEGYGILYNEGVKYYEGEWKGGKKHGKGDYFYPGEYGNMFYVGNFVNDFFEGEGTYKLITKDAVTELIGNFKESKLEGVGVQKMTFFSGGSSEFKGEFKNGDKYNGVEILIGKTGKEEYLEYVNGKIKKQKKK